MSDWLRIDNSTFRDVTPDPEIQQHDKGPVIRMMMSPHAMPIAMRGLLVKQGQSFRIEFRYIDDEKTVERTMRDGVKIESGKNSNRIHAIELPGHMVDGGEVELRMSVEKITQDYGNSFKGRLNHFLDDNLLSARSAVEQAGDRLLQFG